MSSITTRHRQPPQRKADVVTGPERSAAPDQALCIGVPAADALSARPPPGQQSAAGSSMKPSAVSIRDFRPADRAAVTVIVHSVLREYGLQPDGASVDADLDDIPGHYFDRGGVFRVLADQNGRVVGCGGLRPLRGGSVELRKMYLLPALRGRGLGRRLLEDLIAAARRLGFSRVELETASVLREAIGLYRSFGFKPVKRANLVSRCDQAYALDLGSESVQPGTAGAARTGN
jgi:GNAT superfamily N-acetyltransferase